MKREEKSGFQIVYITEDDIKRETEKQISELTEDKKTDFIFNGQSFYELGYGHDFCFGFFTEYLTKHGIKGRCYVSGNWLINNEWYDFLNNEFKDKKIKEMKIYNLNPVLQSDIKFPVIENVNNKLLSDDLIAVKPIG